MFNMSYKMQKRVILVLFLFVPLLLLATFSYFPAIKLIELSFSKWNGIAKSYPYVGFSNYLDIFNDPSMLMTFQNNAAYVVVALFQTIFALYLAVVLNSRVIFRNFFKSSIFMPTILNGVATAFMFNFLYNFESSPINTILRNIGLEQYAVKWLGAGYFSNFSLAFIGLWKNTGFAMVVFLGALQSIPKEYYEAADIDGANFLTKIRYIILPSIKTVVELNLFLSINGSLQAFFESFIITHGGPAGRTDTFVTKTVSTAFEFHNFGMASAMGVILMIIIMIVVSIQRRFLREDGEK